jgi:putative transposase
MARLPRLVVPGHPHHVIHRGHNRQPIVSDDEDRRQFLALLGECAKAHGLAIHAYVLMDNHLHLLATPSTEESLARTMQAHGRRYVAAFNLRHGRTGTLWEGRFRAGLIDSEAYFLVCLRYIELNPVRAGMVAAPEAFPWSSAALHLGRGRDPLVTEHPMYWALGNTPFEREAAYREFLDAGVAEDERRRVTEAALKGWPMASARFLGQIQDSVTRPVVPRKAGRPRKAAAVKPSDNL